MSNKMLRDSMQRLRGKKRANESEEIGSDHHQEEKTGNLNRFVMRQTKVDGATQNSSLDVPSTIGNARTGIVKAELVDHSPQYSYQVHIMPANRLITHGRCLGFPSD